MNCLKLIDSFDFSLDRPILEEYIDENFLKEVRQC